MKYLIALLAFASPAFAQTTWTVTEPSYTLSSTGTQYKNEAACVTAAEAQAAGTYLCQSAGPTSIVGVPNTTPPPPPGTFWIYYNGIFTWAGDFSYAAKINYEDTTGVPLSGHFDIAMTTSSWGAWQPYGCNGTGNPAPECKAVFSFDSAGYTKLTFALKPSYAGARYQVQFVGVGDVQLNCSKSLTNTYGPTPQQGVWAVYTIPLSDLCVGGGINIYKFAIQDESGKSGVTTYVDNVGLTP